MSQNEKILEHLKNGNTITPLEALERFGCMRLGSRINDLREDHIIETENEENGGKRYARYRYVQSIEIKNDMFLSKDAEQQHEWSKK